MRAYFQVKEKLPLLGQLSDPVERDKQVMQEGGDSAEMGWQAVRAGGCRREGEVGEPALVEVLFSWEQAAGDPVTGSLGAEVASQ